MDVNTLPKTVTRQRRGCDLNPGASAPESSTLTARLLSYTPCRSNLCYYSHRSTRRHETVLLRQLARCKLVIVEFFLQEALLTQTDRATRCVSRNLVNSCTTVGASCTTNREEIEVMELEGYSRPTCNNLCVQREVGLPLFLEVPELPYSAM